MFSVIYTVTAIATGAVQSFPAPDMDTCVRWRFEQTRNLPGMLTGCEFTGRGEPDAIPTGPIWIDPDNSSGQGNVSIGHLTIKNSGVNTSSVKTIGGHYSAHRK